MGKLLLVVFLALAMVGCGSGKGAGDVSGGGEVVSPEGGDVKPATDTCGVQIDESSLKAAAVSWMRVARDCGGRN